MVKKSQEKISPTIERNKSEGFGERLKAAFQGASNAEIARKLSVSEPAVGNYIADNVPKLEILLKIYNLTKISVDWLLFGKIEEKNEIPSSEQDIHDAAVLLETQLLGKFTLEELRNLRELAAANGKSLQEIIHRLVIESLQIRALSKPRMELRFYDRTDEIASVPVWGEIRGGGKLHYFGERHLLEIPPSVEKRRTGKEFQSPAQIVKIPRAVVLDIKGDFEDLFLNPNMFHAFRIVTDEFGDDGIVANDIIVCGYIFRRWSFTEERNGVPVLIEQNDNQNGQNNNTNEQDNKTKMLIRRMYHDPVNRYLFSFHRIRPHGQLERIQDFGLSQVHYIYGVVKS